MHGHITSLMRKSHIYGTKKRFIWSLFLSITSIYFHCKDTSIQGMGTLFLDSEALIYLRQGTP